MEESERYKCLRVKLMEGIGMERKREESLHRLPKEKGKTTEEENNDSKGKESDVSRCCYSISDAWVRYTYDECI